MAHGTLDGTQFVEAGHGNANTLKTDGEIEAKRAGEEKEETKLRRWSCGRTSAATGCGGGGAELTPAPLPGGSVPAVEAACQSRSAAGRWGGGTSNGSPWWGGARHSPGRVIRTAGDADAALPRPVAGRDPFRVRWRAEDDVVDCLTCP